MPNKRSKSLINIAAVPKPSPFRYPGGKSWLIPYVRQWLDCLPKPIHFIEPFAGGANVGLTMAFEARVEHVTLVEIDKDVAAVWQTLLGNHASSLGSKIMEFPITKSTVRTALKKQPRTQLDRAFSTLLKNRVRRGGIMTDDANLLKLGENGKGIKSRWYPKTLRDRISKIYRRRQRISFFYADGLEFIRLTRRTGNLAYFIDPPYTNAGQRLYKHNEIDHRELFKIVKKISANWLLTYENTKEVRSLVKEFGFAMRRVRMQTSHHRVKIELLISRDLSWFRLVTKKKKS